MNYCPHLTGLDGDCVMTNNKKCLLSRSENTCFVGMSPLKTVHPFHNSKAKKAGYPKRT